MADQIETDLISLEKTFIAGSKSSEKIKLHPSWKSFLKEEFEKDYMTNLKSFLKSQLDQKKTIFPKGDDYFSALNTTSFDDVKVVIVGQDPYHGPHQAHGLCFSVQKNVKIPPSLLNIYKELKNDLGFEIPKHGYLVKWAEQGVLLLNAVLTVESGMANSHQGKGWEQFTDKIIQVINDNKTEVVFVLWGSYAQKKGAFVDRKKHFVIEGPHPSPLSAHRGFFGSRPFSKINNYLGSRGKNKIDWEITD